jgi:transposase
MLAGMDSDEQIAHRFAQLAPTFNERSLRLFAAAEATALGYGGVSRLSRITGLSRPTIEKGQRELRDPRALSSPRIRRSGGGRKKTCDVDSTLLCALEELVEPLSRGDPMSPLRWTCKSTRTLADALVERGHATSQRMVWTLLHRLGFSLQANRKTQEGNQHPDRNAQFEHINAQVSRALRAGSPVISVDTKKKELIGNYKNNGRKWHRKDGAPKVQGHDFPRADVPRAYPYGIYDLANNTGHVVIGTDHDTGQFAVASIRGWWRAEGSHLYPNAKRLLITADGGGSNGYRLRLWKRELQRLSNTLGIPVSVCHFPPGTSKWNKVEHRLFSFISSNWRGEPLTDYETMANLISATKTAAGLTVTCVLDRRRYPLKTTVSDEEFEQINMKQDTFHGEWNYTIRPQAKR